MPHLPFMTWDYKDQLIGVGLSVCKNNYSSEENKPESCPDDCPDGNTGDEEKANCTKTQRAYYTYNAEGERVRKVVVKGNIKEERFYLGDYEHFTKTTSGAVNFTRESVHVSDDKKRIVLIERKDQDAPVIRYQYGDHLGSASLELNQEAHIITYEEYHPFGTTSYRSGKSETEASLKRYKYVGKERDEESGLYYYGARYYAAWICRFVSVDPMKEERTWVTSYNYCQNNPVNRVDEDGRLDKWPGVTYFFFEGDIGAGVAYGFNYVEQTGIAKDEIGKTHFTLRSKIYIANQGKYDQMENPKVIGGASLSLSAGITQDWSHETYLGDISNFNGEMGGFEFYAAAGGEFAFGEERFSLKAGIGVGAKISFINTEVVESISLTKDQANQISDMTDVVTESWIVRDKTLDKNTGIWTGTVATKNVEGVIMYSDIKVNSKNRKMKDGENESNGIWASPSYINESQNVE